MVTPPATAPTVTAAGADPSLAAAHREMLADGGLQFEFATFIPPNPPDWLEPLMRALQAVAPFLQYVFWAGVAIVVLLILYVIGTEILRRLPDRKKAQKAPEPERPVYRPAAARAHALLEEADRLAAEGRYSEAVRVLLHRSIEDIERTFALAIGPGLTSREISQLEPLSSQGRSVFSSIARAVEVSLFGGRALGAGEFIQCRESYASFALQGAKR